MSAVPDAKAGHPGARRSRLFAQDGLTLMEVLVAMAVLVIGLLGYFGTITASGTAITGAERADAMTQIGEQALQAVEALPYASVSDSSTPARTTTSDTTNPTYYLVNGPVAGSSCTTAITCYQWNPSSATSAEPVDVNAATGKVAPGPTTVVVAAPSGATCSTGNTTNCQQTYALYVFVTDSTDSVCSQSGVTCSSTTSYKRVTVAVKNLGPGSPYNPLYFTTFVGDDAGGSLNPLTATGPTGATTSCIDGGTTVSCTH
ncbi:MAG: prepilin-type N-terminal cleavage/methylation domain-containing protein [Solirubrobacteraceae bacterium]|jgi:prepilin-type N-terminal cleavage/methylation domain-containing protein